MQFRFLHILVIMSNIWSWFSDQVFFFMLLVCRETNVKNLYFYFGSFLATTALFSTISEIIAPPLLRSIFYCPPPFLASFYQVCSWIISVIGSPHSSQVLIKLCSLSSIVTLVEEESLFFKCSPQRPSDPNIL